MYRILYHTQRIVNRILRKVGLKPTAPCAASRKYVSTETTRMLMTHLDVPTRVIMADHSDRLNKVMYG